MKWAGLGRVRPTAANYIRGNSFMTGCCKLGFEMDPGAELAESVTLLGYIRSWSVPVRHRWSPLTSG